MWIFFSIIIALYLYKIIELFFKDQKVKSKNKLNDDEVYITFNFLDQKNKELARIRYNNQIIAAIYNNESTSCKLKIQDSYPFYISTQREVIEYKYELVDGENLINIDIYHGKLKVEHLLP